RRRHTRSKRDWSSDVCSSDLIKCTLVEGGAQHFGFFCGVYHHHLHRRGNTKSDHADNKGHYKYRNFTRCKKSIGNKSAGHEAQRSEERRVGKESRWRASAHKT